MSDLLERFGYLPARVLDPGEVLLDPKDPPGPMYILRSGELEVRSRGRAVTHVREPGSPVGEISVLLRRPPTAQVVATSRSEVLVVEEAATRLVDEPDLLHGVAVLLARRLTAMTSYVVDLRDQYADNEGHLGVMDLVLSTLVNHTATDGPRGSQRGDMPS